MTDEKRGKGIPFVKGSETSADAADSMVKPSAGLRSAVLHHIIRCGKRGATDEEVQDALDMAPNTQRPRRIELEKSGAVYKKFFGGRQVKRTTKSGRKAGVYIFTSLVEEWGPAISEPEKESYAVPDEFIPCDNKDLADKISRVSFICDIAEKELLGTGGTLPDNEGLREIMISLSDASSGAIKRIESILLKRISREDMGGFLKGGFKGGF